MGKQFNNPINLKTKKLSKMHEKRGCTYSMV